MLTYCWNTEVAGARAGKSAPGDPSQPPVVHAAGNNLLIIHLTATRGLAGRIMQRPFGSDRRCVRERRKIVCIFSLRNHPKTIW